MSSSALAARLGVVAGVAGFWTFAAVGAAVEPGYDPSRDYLSALASVGAQRPALGLGMFVCGAGAVLAAAGVLRAVSPRAILARRALVAASGFVALAGVARVTCLAGAGGCSAGPLDLDQVTLSSRTHGVSVAAYQVAFTVGLLALAVAARADRRRALASVAAVGAVLTPFLALDPLPLPEGLSQRLWVAAGHLVLVLLATWPRGASSSPA